MAGSEEALENHTILLGVQVQVPASVTFSSLGKASTPLELLMNAAIHKIHSCVTCLSALCSSLALRLDA